MTDKTQTKQLTSVPTITSWNQQIKWMTETRELIFTPEDIKREFSDNPNVTLKECVIFLQKCVSLRIDPYLGDAHLIKFKNYAAQLIVGKYAFLKIAQRSGVYDGYKAGIIVMDTNKTVHRREGCMVFDGEILIGGWGQVFRKDQKVPAYDEVPLKEYLKKTSNGEVNSQWRNMPCTMIRKVGLVHALREAFPEDLRGIYDESELPAIQSNQEGEDQSAKERINDIFGYKNSDKEEIVEAEIEEVTQDKPDILLNELKIYVKALKLSDEKINQLFEKHNVASWEELTDEIKQKCIDRLKPQYDALKQNQNETEEAIQGTFELTTEGDK